MSFSQVAVSGTVLTANATAASGASVNFTLNTAITDGTTVVAVQEQTAHCASDGTFSITLVANDDLTTIPTGTYYSVTGKHDNGVELFSFNIVVPSADAGPGVNLFTLAQLPNPSVQSPYVAKIKAGSGVTLSPTTGTGTVTVISTGGGGGIPGVTVSGTPATGNVLTATSTSAADWQAPAGGTPAASAVTFNPAGLTNTSSTNVQSAMADYDAAITQAVEDIPDVSAVETQAANSHGDLFQNETTLAWPANPGDGRTYTWHGAGQWTGNWVSGGPSGGYVVGAGINGPSGNPGVYVCNIANTDTTFTLAHWNLIAMNAWDDIQLA